MISVSNVATDKKIGMTFTVPKKSGDGYVSFQAGTSPWSWNLYDPETFDALLHEIRAIPRSDVLYGELRLGNKRVTGLKYLSKGVLEFGDMAEIFSY